MVGRAEDEAAALANHAEAGENLAAQPKAVECTALQTLRDFDAASESGEALGVRPDDASGLQGFWARAKLREVAPAWPSP